jgi:lipopolysaccharide/colanic/teichoic acid biosynthesis glycosyltransferase
MAAHHTEESSVKISEIEKQVETAVPALEPPRPAAGPSILSEEYFHKMICVERKRAERSGKPFLLMLLDTGRVLPSQKNGKVLQNVLAALALSTRDTDLTGWYKGNAVVGIMFTEIAVDLKKSILATMLLRVSSALRDCLTLEQFSQISISFHLFPEDWDDQTPTHPKDSALYPDLKQEVSRRRFSRSFKRAMDIAGSLAAVLVFSPIFLLIAAAVRFSSKGPILFRQQRIGQYGQRFTFLKFRSMYVNNNSDVHKEYVRKLIAGKADRKGRDGVFKITDDPRITAVGKLLRRTSLDELPQFFNVLRGDMSLVGPRPPLPYEVEAYDVWHRRRLLEARPGITGLWQVNGRSRTKFDDMVRLDLQYARKQSLWLDLKILVRTPAAVFSGDGAY